MPTATADSSKLLRSSSAIVSSSESGQHLLKIEGYSYIKGAISSGDYILSRPFRVGGYNWQIRYYPNGYYSSYSYPDYIAVRLYLGYVNQAARAHFTFSLLDQAGEPVSSYTHRYGLCSFYNDEIGPTHFIQKSVLERSEYLKNDCFSIRCDVTVFNRPEAKDVVVDDDTGSSSTPPPPSPVVVPVPPSDLTRHLAGLLATGEGADVTFEVDGRTFPAHRYVLAARSPVFRTALKENAGAIDVVRIDDMEAQDFEALLRYVYTDSLPEMKGGDAAAMLPDLVAAANRYKMDRLRLVCEDKLCGYVNGRTVSMMLAFAGEQHCHGLREKCLRFLDDPANLRAILQTEGLEHLTKSYPSVLKDLIAKLAIKL